MSLSTIMSMVVTLIGALYTFSTLMLPAARIGNPTAPKVFPLILGIALLILGFLLIVAELRNLPKTEEEKKKAKASLAFGPVEKNIIFTILNGILYALLFNPIGYIFSTFIFLNLQLLIFRGKQKWLNSMLISTIFAVFAFLLFNTFLGVFLPTSPLQFI